MVTDIIKRSVKTAQATAAATNAPDDEKDAYRESAGGKSSSGSSSPDDKQNILVEDGDWDNNACCVGGRITSNEDLAADWLGFCFSEGNLHVTTLLNRPWVEASPTTATAASVSHAASAAPSVSFFVAAEETAAAGAARAAAAANELKLSTLGRGQAWGLGVRGDWKVLAVEGALVKTGTQFREAVAAAVSAAVVIQQREAGGVTVEIAFEPTISASVFLLLPLPPRLLSVTIGAKRSKDNSSAAVVATENPEKSVTTPIQEDGLQVAVSLGLKFNFNVDDRPPLTGAAADEPPPPPPHSAGPLGMAVAEVGEGSKAERAGVKVGWRLIAVAGAPVTSPIELKQV
jgi:hypothetical protein